jgi:hypothetical protein
MNIENPERRLVDLYSQNYLVTLLPTFPTNLGRQGLVAIDDRNAFPYRRSASICEDTFDVSILNLLRGQAPSDPASPTPETHRWPNDDARHQRTAIGDPGRRSRVPA